MSTERPSRHRRHQGSLLLAATVVALTVLFGGAGCATAPVAGDPSALETLENQASAESTQSGFAQVVRDHYATDAVEVLAGQPPLEGRDAIATFYDKALSSDASLSWTPVGARASGEMGVTWGSYQLTMKGQVVETGQYTTVWQRQADGAWQIVLDTGTPNPPPAKQTTQKKR
jgi:ketosteroid isomerase-like protein